MKQNQNSKSLSPTTLTIIFIILALVIVLTRTPDSIIKQKSTGTATAAVTTRKSEFSLETTTENTPATSEHDSSSSTSSSSSKKKEKENFLKPSSVSKKDDVESSSSSSSSTFSSEINQEEWEHKRDSKLFKQIQEIENRPENIQFASRYKKLQKMLREQSERREQQIQQQENVSPHSETSNNDNDISNNNVNDNNDIVQQEQKIRPHQREFDSSLFLNPKPLSGCPHSSNLLALASSQFCVPATGRPWGKISSSSSSSSSSTSSETFPPANVFPLPYSIPEDLIAIPGSITEQDKTLTCSRLKPASGPKGRNSSHYFAKTEKQYMNEYRKAWYAVTCKKGGWESMRTLEIIAGGAMPYFVDIEYAPIYSLANLPKKLLLEARDLPGVSFECESMDVTIDFSIFPKQKYFLLLNKLLKHAWEFLSARSIGKYVLRIGGFGNIVEDVHDHGHSTQSENNSNSSNNNDNNDNNNNTNNKNKKKKKPRILFLFSDDYGHSLRARMTLGSYNTYSLMIGLRQILGEDDGFVIDPKPVIRFMYKDYEHEFHREKRNSLSLIRMIYGRGFSYAFRLNNTEKLEEARKEFVETREVMLQKIKNREFDLIIFGDPQVMQVRTKKSGRFIGYKYLTEILAAGYKKHQIMFVQGLDVAYMGPAITFDIYYTFRHNVTVLLREVPDCRFFASPGRHYSSLSPSSASSNSNPFLEIPQETQKINKNKNSKQNERNVMMKHRTIRAEVLKRCLWYARDMCNDDVGMLDKGLKALQWPKFFFSTVNMTYDD